MSARFVVEADGGSRGNPGQAAYGAVVRDAASGEVLVERGARIGIASNNVAEYRGLIAGLEAVRELDPDAAVEVRMDSKLVVEQMSGRWQVKHPDMKVLAKQALAILPRDHLTFTWVPRERNRAADRLVNAALDGRLIEDLPPADPSPDPPADPGGPRAASTNHVVGWAPDLGVPTTTVLVRHGETTDTQRKLFSGTGGTDPALTETGEQQASAMGRLLANASTDETVAAVLTSPLRRTRQTAELVAAELGLEVIVEEDLRETAFGDWDGYSYAEVAARWPEQLAAWLASTSVAPPFGESFDDVQRRVIAARVRLAEAYPGQRIVVVSHVTPIKALVRDALGAPPSALFRMELSPGSATTISWWDGDVASLRAFNVVPPVPD